MGVNFRVIDNVRAFHRFVLGYYTQIQAVGKDLSQLAGSSDSYRSLMIPRQILPAYGAEASVFLHPDWPEQPQHVLANALTAFSTLDYDAIYQPRTPKGTRPDPAVVRQGARCVADYHTPMTFHFWSQEDRRLGCFFEATTSDLIGSFPSDYLSAQVMQNLVGAVYFLSPGTLMYQGAVHIHERDIPLLDRLQASDDVDYTLYTRWIQNTLPRWNNLLDSYHDKSLNIKEARERFELLQALALSTASILNRGSIYDPASMRGNGN